jgi:membrane protease YdiL (CAAX protease family)
LLGAVWATWHIPMFLGVDVPVSAFPWMLLYFIAGSVVFSWLYFRTQRSLLIAVFAHVGAHLNNSHQTLPQDSTPLILQTIGLCVFAVGVLVGDRQLWRSQRGIMK